jgi:hypothetical protein
MKRRGFLGALGAAIAAPLLPVRAEVAAGPDVIATNPITATHIGAQVIRADQINFGSITRTVRLISDYDRDRVRHWITDDGRGYEVVTEDGRVAERLEFLA